MKFNDAMIDELKDYGVGSALDCIYTLVSERAADHEQSESEVKHWTEMASAIFDAQRRVINSCKRFDLRDLLDHKETDES